MCVCTVQVSACVFVLAWFHSIDTLLSFFSFFSVFSHFVFGHFQCFLNIYSPKTLRQMLLFSRGTAFIRIYSVNWTQRARASNACPKMENYFEFICAFGHVSRSLVRSTQYISPIMPTRSHELCSLFGFSAASGFRIMMSKWFVWWFRRRLVTIGNLDDRFDARQVYRQHARTHTRIHKKANLHWLSVKRI